MTKLRPAISDMISVNVLRLLQKKKSQVEFEILNTAQCWL